MKQGQDRTKHGSKRSFGLHGARPGQCFASLCVGGSPRKPVDSRGKAIHQELKVKNRSSDWKMIFEEFDKKKSMKNLISIFPEFVFCHVFLPFWRGVFVEMTKFAHGPHMLETWSDRCHWAACSLLVPLDVGRSGCHGLVAVRSGWCTRPCKVSWWNKAFGL